MVARIFEPVISHCLPPKDQVGSLPSRRELSNIGRPLKFESGKLDSVLQLDRYKHRSKNWQEERRHKLIASIFTRAVGFWSRRRVQLWPEKIGAREPLSGNIAMGQNNHKEKEVIERYELITGNYVLNSTFQIFWKDHPGNDWLAASPDVVVDPPSRGVLEIKCPLVDENANQASPWRWIPLYYISQAQSLMEILNRDWMDFYFWTDEGSGLFRIHRDRKYWGTPYSEVGPLRFLVEACAASKEDLQ